MYLASLVTAEVAEVEAVPLSEDTQAVLHKERHTGLSTM
jgi:hypothetical protein